jgi:tRNA-dihydrouridine synthase
MSNFWPNLPKPFFALAPMQDVSDNAFREIFAKYGKPDVCFTEFVNVDGLTHPEGFERLKIDLEYTENQRPIVAQIWGRDPEKFFKAAGIIVKLGFDGVDINFGCPQDKEISQKTCAYLIREPELAGQIIEATIKGAGGLPVSVKTRLGYSNTDEMNAWVSQILKYPIAALTLHARTKLEKSSVPAHWEKVKEAVVIRDKLLENRDKDKTPLIIGNGDIKSREEGLERIKQSGCDGVMIARGSFGNPWIFRPLGGTNPKRVFPFQRFAASFFHRFFGRGINPQTKNTSSYHPSVKERLDVMMEHAELYEKMYKGIKSFPTMRKNFKAYASGFDGAGELRTKLMETKDAGETKVVVEEYLRNGNFK